jgi:amino acid adenylation domain-containing protein
LLDRDENIVIAMLAIMKCRAIIVAMDKEYPLARLQYIAVNSGCRLCITDSEGSLIADNTDTISPPEIYDLPAGDMLNETAPNGYAPAYIIYTSGSTGAPKGVVISHASLYDYVKNFCAWFRLTEKDSVLQQSSFCFDTSIEETFPILAAGGRLVIAANNKDIPQLLDETVREGITVLSTNPWVVQFLNNDSRTLAACKLRILISGGDVLKPEFISRLSGRFDLYNTYGPTESTVCATYYKIENVTEQVIPIGKPITNRNIYIVDDYDNLQLPGLAGEICIAGAGLAMRYHEMPEQTAKSFVFLPACGEKVYRTGDLGIWLPDGNIVFAGRKDRQISINGFRIEPGEIEHCINSVKGITDSLVVAVNTNGHKILVAYVVSPEENRPGIAEIKNAIGGRLPAPMMPSSIVIMEQFPLLPNGKIDYSKLPAPGNDAVTMEYEAPATPLEEKLAAVWKQLLNRTEVGRNNDFFELGGHSLLANQFVSIVREECGTELSLKTFYRNPNIRMLAAVINESLAGSNELTVITPAPADADIPLSYAQERLWFLNQLDENNTAYNVPRALKMTGELHMDILESVFTKLVERHTILRTVFRIKDGAPVQVVLPPAHFHIPVLDYSGIDEGQRMQTIKEFILQEGNQRFDLANGPLLKVTILSLAPKESILVLCEHHLVHDGWTQGVLLNEFIQIYSAELSGQPFPFAPLSIQYGDFAYWQKKYYNEEKLKESLAYWVQQLNGLDPGLNLPVYKPRPAVNTGRGDMEVMHIPGDVYFRLLDFCAAYNVTPFMTMLGVFKLVLHKYSRNTDICVGTGVANRRIKELNNMLGMVINTIALRTRIEPGNDFLELVNTVKKVCIEGYANEDVPFGEVVNAVNPVRSLSAHPLVQYMFSFMNTPTRHIDLPGLNVEILESYNHSAKFDICIVVVMPVDDPYRNETAAHNPEIIIEWEYNSSIFEKPAMQSMLASFVRLLSEVLADPRRSLDAVNILSAAEERSVLSFSYQSCNPDGSINPLKQRDTLVSLFETQVMHTPQNTALCYNNTVFSYSTLNAVANKLADCLRKEYGLQPGELAAIQLGKNEWQIISILAILKTGAAYVPLGADYPKERTAFMLADCKCRVIIDDAFIKEFAAQQVGYTDANPGAAIGPDSLAYIIYTSGSTGLPKGVMTAHAAAVNLVAAQISAFGIDAAENILQLSAITFDASVEQIFIALTSGACLTLADKDTITDPEKMDSFIANNYITHIHTVPGLLKTFRVKQYPSLKRVIAGGDRCPASLAKDWSRVHTFYNEYGPTETTVTSIELFYTADVEVNTTVPVGRPLANTRVYILDESGNLVPEGVAGEICIGGAGIAKGYLNRPELTAEKFIPDPFYKGGTIYKTGDTGRWLPGGIIEFIGRADEQVKIRGYRIELGEIEHALQNLPGMEAAAVTVHKAEDGENELLAYIVTAQQTDSAVIRQQLNKSLPPYMIPAHFIQIDEMPVTPSGKTDKKKLPSPGTLIMKTGTQYIAPRTETERKLIPIWQEVLGKEQISVTDNFFNLGGHSLKVTKVIARIQDRFGVKPDIKEFFGEPTIEYLAEYLDTIAWIDGKPEETLAGPEEIII